MILIFYSIALFCSLFSNFIVFCFFHKEHSLYFSLLNIITLFEISFIFSKFLNEIMTDKIGEEIMNSIKNKLNETEIFKKFSFGILENIDILSTNNYFFYRTMKTLYVFLNICLCFETIILIKRPFSQSQKKIKFYIIASAILIIITYILQIFFDENNKDKDKGQNRRGFDIKGNYVEFLNFILYNLFIISGIISVIYLVVRFCLHKPLIQSAKNFFVMRHIIYFIVLSAMLIFESRYIFNDFMEIKNIVIFSLGFVMSIIKMSDKFCFKDNNPKNKKGITSTISSNLNVEFMYCILYGMTDIFIKNKNDEQNNSFSKYSIRKTEKVHLIKYVNSINTKNDDLKSIKLKVSLKHGNDSLLEEKDIESESSNYNSNNLYIKSNGEDASIIEYEPEIFNDLRKNDGINDDVMIRVFSPTKNKYAIDKMSESKGKSGSFFFYSHDRKFIIKTISDGERKTLSEILREYYNYIKEHKESLITKIYGIYTVVIKNASSVNIILMQNLFGCSPIHIQRMFDLKGSSVQRKTKNPQKWRRDQVLKDLDFSWLTKVERKLINFKEEDSKNIENILKNDINFYKKMQLMDYSLLFIIIDYPNKIDPDYNPIIGFLDDLKYKGHVYKSDNEQYIYIVGIIDYLQKFNTRKKLEHFFKGLIYGKEKDMISAVRQDLYAQRFFNFMTKNVFIHRDES